jgi:nicotinamide mononucleotide transporter
VKTFAYSLAVLLSLALLLAAWRHWVPVDFVDASAFVTGAWCVWLTVLENIWNWPLGLANNIFFIVLFLRTRLYADTGLQVVYVILGVLGWYWWLYGGRSRTTLRVDRTNAKTTFTLAFLTVGATWGMTLYLRHIHDSAPFLDALTTALSLSAQYLLTKKMIENWYVWMTADVIYIGLYVFKHLYLTSLLYLLFLGLCVLGLRAWRDSLHGPDLAVEVLHG